MGRRRVPQAVRSKIGQPGDGTQPLVDDPPCGPWVETPATQPQEQRRSTGAVEQRGSATAQPVADSPDGGDPAGRRPLLVAFAEPPAPVALDGEVADVEATRLAHPSPARIEQLEQRAVAQP